MGSSQIPATASIPSDNWVLISSVTPTASSTTVTFSSIPLRKKLMLRINNIAPGNGTLTITLNGDTGAKYSIFGFATTSSGTISLTTPLQATDATGFVLGTSLTSANGVLTIEEADTTNVKNVWGFMKVSNPGAGIVIPDILGSYLASAAISSITITTTSTFSATGTVAVYGVSA